LTNPVLPAVEHLLYPLARLLLDRGIGFGTLSEVIKFVMIKESERQLGDAQEGAVTDSRISIATGIHRKEVKRLRALDSHDSDYFTVSLTAQVVAKWTGDPKLRTRQGPKPLPKKKKTLRGFDFEDLVRSISTDVRPKVVLDDMLLRGLASMDEDGLVKLHPDNLALKQGQEETLQYLSMNIHDHLSTAIGNLITPEKKSLERCVHYHGLSHAAVAQLRKISEKQAMQALLAVNKAAQALLEQEKSRGEQRINFGVYFFNEQIDTDSEKRADDA
jgi:hypothetical protein